MPTSRNEDDQKPADKRVLELERQIASLKRRMARQQARFEDELLRQQILFRLASAKADLEAGLKPKGLRRGPGQAALRIEEEVRLVAQSDIFDADWYLAFYPDVAWRECDPARHFVTEGAYELRHPGPGFDSFAYHKAYPDVTDAGVAGFIHYLRNGRAEQRQTSPVGECDARAWKNLA